MTKTIPVFGCAGEHTSITNTRAPTIREFQITLVQLYEQWVAFEEALCQDMVDALWQLWAVHAAVAVFLYIALYVMSYVKQKCKVLALLEDKGVVLAKKCGPAEHPRDFAPKSR